MALEKLTLENVGNVDPAIVLDWTKKIAAAVQDCYDRPGLKKARKVILEMEVAPVISDGRCECVEARFTLIAKAPAAQTRDYQLTASPNGAILVNPASPGNIRQRTLDEIDPGTGEVRGGS